MFTNLGLQSVTAVNQHRTNTLENQYISSAASPAPTLSTKLSLLSPTIRPSPRGGVFEQGPVTAPWLLMIYKHGGLSLEVSRPDLRAGGAHQC